MYCHQEHTTVHDIRIYQNCSTSRSEWNIDDLIRSLNYMNSVTLNKKQHTHHFRTDEGKLNEMDSTLV